MQAREDLTNAQFPILNSHPKGSSQLPTDSGYVGSDRSVSMPWWYDNGMTTTKIAITLPVEQLARAQRAVRAGRADSVSGYIARALAEQEREESLRTLVRDLIVQHGEPSKQEILWAKRALGPRRRA